VRVTRSGGFLGGLPTTPVVVTVLRPDGSVFATDNDGTLNIPITPQELRHSRGFQGLVRRWKLRVDAPASVTYKISAQVFNTVRIPVSVLQTRLNSLLGENGEKLTLGANWNSTRKTNLITLRLNDVLLAETFGIHHILGHFDRGLNAGLDLDVPVTGRDYVMSASDMVLEEGFFRAQAQCRSLQSTSLKVRMGASVERRKLKLVSQPGPAGNRGNVTLQPTGDVLVPPNLPMFSLEVTTSGQIHIAVDHWDDADLIVPSLRIEIAIEVDAQGRLAARAWLDPDSVTFGGDEGSPHHPLRNDANHMKQQLIGKSESIARSFSAIFEDLFDRLLGGVFRYTAARWTGTAMEFVEPERRPKIGYVARGDFGISVNGTPGTLVNTWSSPNLAKIEHIVVLVMENRSFDHVLGHLSLAGAAPGSAVNPNVDGLTQAIIDRFATLTPATKIRPLRDAGFPANAAGLKTKIPLDVGHGVRDVTQQINNKTMTGFAANFAAKHSAAAFQRTGCQPQDALGYYTANDLAMYGFLAREFAICDRYFCSHPGPTLPNRMFTLIGDLQRDRNGEPRINNGIDGSFFLSRDQTIFDVLTQRNVTWRVYESPPSVTMLRMFARYAGDDTNIRDIKHFKSDILATGLPSVTFIDPALHDAPANDDHPPADMLHGQYLIQDIYKALRANPAVWDKTLFVVTYDEHGGLFDHVPPAVAEVLQDPRKILDSQTVATAEVGGTGVRPVSGAVTGILNGAVGAVTAVGGTVAGTVGSTVVGAVGGVIGSVGGVVGGVLDGVLDARPVTPPRYLPNEEITYGVRVPTFLVSPLVEKGAVIKRQFDHASILKTILIKFCANDRPFLSDRVQHAFDLGSALTRSQPRNDQPELPALPTLPDQRRPAAAMRPMRAITSREITQDDSDWHEFMGVLSRQLRS
jgi:phospholipase C